jgi:RNA polymerase sigma-70 factor (ECF subfamily)
VTRLAYRLLGWRGDVEDLVHDVFLAAFKQRHRFRGEASAWTWLAAIAINQCRSHRRRQVLRFRWLRNRNRPEHAARSSERAEQDETAQRVRDAVAQLRIRDRELIVLHYLEELSTEQISAITGVSMKTIHVRLHRARQRLKALLEQK